MEQILKDIKDHVRSRIEEVLSSPDLSTPMKTEVIVWLNRDAEPSYSTMRTLNNSFCSEIGELIDLHIELKICLKK